jgi:hypothetical protein
MLLDSFLAGEEPSPLVLSHLLAHWMINYDDCGALVELMIGKETEVLGQNLTQYRSGHHRSYT